MDPKLIDYLKKLPLLKGLPETIIHKLANNIKPVKLAKGKTLIRKGTASNSLFIIHSGWLKVVTEGLKGEEVMLNQCGPGQVMGEMALVDQTLRSTNVIAMTDAVALEIRYRVVLAIMSQHPVLAIAFVRDLADRVRFANTYIEETILWSQHIAAGNYDFVQEQVTQTQTTIVGMKLSHQARANAFLSAFFKMVEEVKAREDELKKQVHQLIITIDEEKRQEAVDELTDTEFFENLQAAAKKMRRTRRKKRPKKSP